jgi:hypothetical protein
VTRWCGCRGCDTSADQCGNSAPGRSGVEAAPGDAEAAAEAEESNAADASAPEPVQLLLTPGHILKSPNHSPGGAY